MTPPWYTIIKSISFHWDDDLFISHFQLWYLCELSSKLNNYSPLASYPFCLVAWDKNFARQLEFMRAHSDIIHSLSSASISRKKEVKRLANLKVMRTTTAITEGSSNSNNNNSNNNNNLYYVRDFLWAAPVNISLGARTENKTGGDTRLCLHGAGFGWQAQDKKLYVKCWNCKDACGESQLATIVTIARAYRVPSAMSAAPESQATESPAPSAGR